MGKARVKGVGRVEGQSGSQAWSGEPAAAPPTRMPPLFPARLRRARNAMDADAPAAAPSAPADGGAMDTTEFGAPAPPSKPAPLRVARPVLKRGARTTKQRQRKAAAAKKAAAVAGRRAGKAARRAVTGAAKREAKSLWTSAAGMAVAAMTE